MNESEESDIYFTDGFPEICPKVFNERALKIDNHADHQLNVRNGCCPVPYRIIGFGKFRF